jgi:hypothetical protein
VGAPAVRPVRRDDATHPRELPDPEPPTNLVSEWREGDPCEMCEEDGDVDDPITHFKKPNRPGVYVMAHAECGGLNGLELA